MLLVVNLNGIPRTTPPFQITKRANDMARTAGIAILTSKDLKSDNELVIMPQAAQT
jgi:hypothetical protein